MAALGVHLTPVQLGQITECRTATVYVCFDADLGGAGSQAAQRLIRQLQAAGMDARQVLLPLGSDPNSYFAVGATAAGFQRRLQEARP